jgi:hypothetical protein
LKKNPNPQGKGLAPVLESLAESRAMIPAVAKQINQISSELFTSMFVLHSQFQFKPVVGKSYWLYQRENQFQLSLISPQEWGNDAFGLFVGECILQPDITWSLSLDDAAAKNEALMAYIKDKKTEFEQAMQSVESVDSVLPFYLEGFPFYQRIFASALANSLKQSMILSGIQGLSYSEAQKCLSTNS